MGGKRNLSETFRKALAAHQAGDLSKAEQLYRRILKAHPKHFDALHLLGVIHAQRDRFPEAVRLMDRALKIRPDDDQALYNLGNALLPLKRPEDALACFDRVLAMRPDHFDAHNNRGNALQELGRLDDALESFDKALTIRPDYVEAHNNHGNVLQEMGRPDSALQSYEKALAIRADYAEAHNNRGCVLEDLDRLDEAIESYDKTLAIRPDYVDAHNNRGRVLHELNHPLEALESYDKALAIRPDHAEVLNNRGNTLNQLNRFDESLKSYDKALAIRPDYAEAHNNRGNVLRKLRRMEDALESYDRALAIEPDTAGTLFNRGNLFQELKLLDEAVEDFQRGMKIDPGYSHARGTLYYAKRHACDWRDYEAETALILVENQAGRYCTTPWQFLAMSESPGDQLRCAQSWQREKYPASDAPLWQGERYRHDRIRVAYVSADFHEHPLAFLMAGLFEQHDRSKFEIFAISFGPDKPSKMRNRLENAFEHFIDVRQKSPREIADLIRDMEIDIAIDRKGYTRDSRTEIFALRPAPVQVNYLAYPGTMGADYIDYIIADRFVIPEAHQQYYAENVVSLPDSYQANDSKRTIAERTPERGEVGLPEKGFVFACFNNNYKITPRMFDIWMRLLVEVEGSVLWLLEANAASSRNLRKEAELRGVDPDRLIIAPYLDHEDHLARLRLADLFLDTLPFNAHTTASDALWAGVPVLTCLGTTFAGRVGAGLLSAVGLPEMITNSLEEYAAKALELARDTDQLSKTRMRLEQNRRTYPLFDTDRYRRNLEAAFETMWQRYQRGEKPSSFSVSID